MADENKDDDVERCAPGARRGGTEFGSGPVVRSPQGIRRAILKRAVAGLPFNMKYELFYQMGRALGVTAYQANGSSGPIFGHIYDQSLIKYYLRDGEWSSDITDMISAFFADRGGTFYDIGANVGTVIIPVSMNRAVRCVGFEPDAGNFALLRANVHIQDASNIEVMRVAVADTKGQRLFVKSAYNSGDHRLSRDGDIVVDVIALDDLAMPAGPFVAKIDTQGAEPSIFKGGEKTLARADLVIAEFWPWGMKRMGLDPAPILEFASRYFSKGAVLQHNEKMGSPKGIAEVICDLQNIAHRGGEFDQADLILIK